MGKKMKVFILQKKRFSTFIKRLMQKEGYEVIAPVQTDELRFEPIDDPKQITLEKQTYYPAKQYFFPQKQTLFRFDGTSITVPSQASRKRAFFGLRKCDLNAIRRRCHTLASRLLDKQT